MKKGFSTLLLAAGIPALSFAQQPLKQGVILYDDVIALRKQMAKENPALAPFLPENLHLKMQVAFKEGKFAVTTENEPSPKGGVQMPMTVSSDERELVDLNQQTARTEYIFNGRAYYTEAIAKGKKPVVTYSSETKKILGYTCNKAVLTSDKETYILWYTPAIPYAYSPKGLKLAGLKGAVLQYTDGEQTCTAIRISEKGFSQGALVPNSKARKVTEEQIQDLQEDQIESLKKKTGPTKTIQL